MPLLRSAFGFRDGLPLTTYCHMSQASAREPLPPVESRDFCFRKIGCSVRPFPAGPPLQSFVLEFLLTAILMFVILPVSTGSRDKGITAGIVVGSVIALEAMFAGPICGASMNPARSLAPAVVSTHLQNLWIYLAAPVAGAFAGVFVCRYVREKGCC